MARIYPVSHSSDGRFSGRTNRCDGVRHSDDSRWSEFLPDALLRILRWQTGRRKNRPILAQTGYDKKRDQPGSSLHRGIICLRRSSFQASWRVICRRRGGSWNDETAVAARGTGQRFRMRIPCSLDDGVFLRKEVLAPGGLDESLLIRLNYIPVRR